jgi:hypothetical protein
MKRPIDMNEAFYNNVNSLSNSLNQNSLHTAITTSNEKSGSAESQSMSLFLNPESAEKTILNIVKQSSQITATNLPQFDCSLINQTENTTSNDKTEIDQSKINASTNSPSVSPSIAIAVTNTQVIKDTQNQTTTIYNNALTIQNIVASRLLSRRDSSLSSMSNWETQSVISSVSQNSARKKRRLMTCQFDTKLFKSDAATPSSKKSSRSSSSSSSASDSLSNSSSADSSSVMGDEYSSDEDEDIEKRTESKNSSLLDKIPTKSLLFAPKSYYQTYHLAQSSSSKKAKDLKVYAESEKKKRSLKAVQIFSPKKKLVSSSSKMFSTPPPCKSISNTIVELVSKSAAYSGTDSNLILDNMITLDKKRKHESMVNLEARQSSNRERCDSGESSTMSTSSFIRRRRKLLFDPRKQDIDRLFADQQDDEVSIINAKEQKGNAAVLTSSKLVNNSSAVNNMTTVNVSSVNSTSLSSNEKSIPSGQNPPANHSNNNVSTTNNPEILQVDQVQNNDSAQISNQKVSFFSF